MRLTAFFDFLFPLRGDERVVRDLDTDAFLALVQPRLVPETRPGTAALLPFHVASVRAVIHEAKYHGNPRAFELLGLALREYLTDLDLMGSKHIHIVPVPLGATRLKERGFNQVEEAVKCALKELPFALESTLLVRTRETESQVSLAREKREKNMRGAFLAMRSADPSYTYVLVDDVVTTGATLQAALDALRTAGATDLVPLALAH